MGQSKCRAVVNAATRCASAAAPAQDQHPAPREKGDEAKLAVHCIFNKWIVTGLSVTLRSSFTVAVFLPITRTS